MEAQYVWTGLFQPTGWQGQVTPPNDGSADLYYGGTLDANVTLTSSLDNIHSISFAGGESYIFSSASTVTLALGTGIFAADADVGTAFFTSTINFGVTGSATFDPGNNQEIIAGQITGTGNVTMLEGFIFSNLGAGNTYVGNTTLGDGITGTTFGIWNSSPFGTGTVSILNGAFFAIHGTQTISNNFVFDSYPGANGGIVIKDWDDPITLTGSITLANPVTLDPYTSTNFHLSTPGHDGSVFEPGPLNLNPLVISGSIGQTGGSQSLTINQQSQLEGALFLTGASNTYSGGTVVNSGLVFGSAASIPSSGTIVVNNNGYLGTADTSGGSSATGFSTLLSHVTTGSSGSFGIDTIPGQSTATYAGSMDLSGFTNPNVAIGTATSAILTGTITPQNSNAYRFGGGGGTLYVDTPLTNIGASTQVVMSAPFLLNPLTVYLQASNSYQGSTYVNGGFLIFDGSGAIPGGNQFIADGANNNVGNSYIGYTDLVGFTSLQSNLFLGHFNQGSTWGIIGFDSSNVASPVTINGVDLTGFHDGVFIGTATAAILTGTLTPSTVTNTFQTANTLRLTAAQSGTLTVDSTINNNGSPVSVVLGSPSQYGQFSSGTVAMNGANGYSGGTTLNVTNYSGITVALGNDTALGTGGVTVAEGSGIVGIQADTNSIAISNPITFQDTMTGMNEDSSQLFLTGTHDFTLSGPITGDDTSAITIYNTSPITVTLSGDNSAFHGLFTVWNGTLALPSDNSVGSGRFDFEGGGTIDLTGAMDPIIHELTSNQETESTGSLVLSSGSTLTVDMTGDPANSTLAFDGVISGPGGALTTASLAVNNTTSGSGTALILYGANNYSGGTTISNYGILGVGNSGALGTGTVTVQTTGYGALVLNSGVTLTNPLTFTSGNLAGDGTFNPSGLGLGSTITVGPNQGIAAGVPAFNNTVIAGTLSFAGNLAFNTGGKYYWALQDNGRLDGVSQVDVAGNLDLSSLTAGGFTVVATTYDANGVGGNPASNFNIYASTSWIILTTGGMIQNFSAPNFTIDASNFEVGNSITGSNFFLSENGSDNQLILNFTPVPEPSTWALLGIGLAAIAGARIRGRRQAAAA